MKKIRIEEITAALAIIAAIVGIVVSGPIGTIAVIVGILLGLITIIFVGGFYVGY